MGDRDAERSRIGVFRERFVRQNSGRCDKVWKIEGRRWVLAVGGVKDNEYAFLSMTWTETIIDSSATRKGY